MNDNIEKIEDNGNENERKKKINLALRAVILIVCVAFTVMAVIKVVNEERIKREEERQSIINSGVFHDGIVVQGINIGGMTMEQAKRVLNRAERALSEKVSFVLTYNGQEYKAGVADFDLVFDTNDVLEAAMSIGREGTLKQLKELLNYLKENNKVYAISYKADELSVRSFIGTLAESMYKAPQDAKLTSIADPRTLEYEQKSDSTFVSEASTTSNEERMSYVKEEQGLALDSPKLYATIIGMLESGEYRDIEIPVVILDADITLDNIEERLTLRGKASTSYAKSPYNRSSRVYNIRKAVSLINGIVIEPDEIFSANETLGDRTYEAGWKGAPAIVGAKTEDQAGGGVCQVSTTMYNCVLLSDLEVVDRRGHSSKISYVAGGLDATIDSGHIDFQWRNNTGTKVYVFAWVDTKKKTVNFEMYGEPFPEEYDEIKVSSKKLSTISPRAMKYVVDYDLDPGESRVNVARKYGSVWVSYVTYLKNGEEVETVEIDRTTYNAYAGEMAVGPDIVEVANE